MKNGNLTITSNGGNAALAALIAEAIAPAPTPAKGTIKSILLGAMKTSAIPLTLVAFVSAGKVEVFEGGNASVATSAIASLSVAPTTYTLNPIGSTSSPDWDVKKDGTSVLNAAGVAPSGQTADEALVSLALRPQSQTMTIADLAGRIEDAFSGTAVHPFIVIDQTAETASLYLLTEAQEAEVDAAMTVGTIATITRAEPTVSGPVGPFGI